MNLSFENHCVSNFPSKLEGAGGVCATSLTAHLHAILSSLFPLKMKKK